MSTHAPSRPPHHRLPSRDELQAFYRAIGIPAVASATLAAKMRPGAAGRDGALPPRRG